MSLKVDTRGFSCPIPVVKTKQAMEKNPGETIVVLIESEVAKENILRLAQSQGYISKVEQSSKEYRLILEPAR